MLAYLDIVILIDLGFTYFYILFKYNARGFAKCNLFSSTMFIVGFSFMQVKLFQLLARSGPVMSSFELTCCNFYGLSDISPIMR